MEGYLSDEPLAFGRTAEVFRWGDGRILKLFHTWVEESSANAERRKAMVAHSIGLPTPAVGGIVQHQGRIGLIYERARGLSMFDRLVGDERAVMPMARLLAELHVTLNECSAPREVPEQEDVLAHRIGGVSSLSTQERDALLALLVTLPSGRSLCHGDFHPKNIILTEHGPQIIDWMDATRGNPMADVARTSLLLRGYIAHSARDESEQAAVTLFHDTYLNHYMQRVPGRESEYQSWLPIVAAARLDEGIGEEQQWLVDEVRRGLKNEPQP